MIESDPICSAKLVNYCKSKKSVRGKMSSYYKLLFGRNNCINLFICHINYCFSRSGSRITFFVVVFVFIEVEAPPPQVNATSTAAPASTADIFYTSVQSVLMVQLPIRQPEVIVSTIAVVGK